MVELSEAEALARGHYVRRDDGWPVIYGRVIRGELVTVIYPGWEDPDFPLEHFREMDPGVPAEIYSPASSHPAGGTHRTVIAPHWSEPQPLNDDAMITSWRIWYVAADGEVEKLLVQQFDDEGYFIREEYRGPHGELRTYAIHRYDDQGFAIDRVTHGPDGTVLNTEDMPW